MEKVSVTQIIDYDDTADDDESTSVEVEYSDLDMNSLVALAIAGDQEAIDFLNSTANDAPPEL